MNLDLFRHVSTLVIGLAVLAGCFYLLLAERGDQNQIWLTLGVVITYFFVNQARDSGAASARRSMNQGATTVNTAPDQPVTVYTGEDGVG